MQVNHKDNTFLRAYTYAQEDSKRAQAELSNGVQRNPRTGESHMATAARAQVQADSAMHAALTIQRADIEPMLAATGALYTRGRATHTDNGRVIRDSGQPGESGYDSRPYFVNGKVARAPKAACETGCKHTDTGAHGCQYPIASTGTGTQSRVSRTQWRGGIDLGAKNLCWDSRNPGAPLNMRGGWAVSAYESRQTAMRARDVAASKP